MKPLLNFEDEKLTTLKVDSDFFFFFFSKYSDSRANPTSFPFSVIGFENYSVFSLSALDSAFWC